MFSGDTASMEVDRENSKRSADKISGDTSDTRPLAQPKKGRYKIVQADNPFDADQSKYKVEAKTLWLDYISKSDTKYSQKQMEEIIEFTSSAMTYAKNCMGLELQDFMISMKGIEDPCGKSEEITSKIESGFKSLTSRIEALEKSQKAELKKGNEQISIIEERCKKMQEITVPTERATTYANMVARIDPKQKPSDTFVPTIPTRNYYTVLEIEESGRNEQQLESIKSVIHKNFRKDKIKVDNVIKTKPGNLCLYFNDKEQQSRGIDVLKRSAMEHTKLRTDDGRPTHLALRRVPKELSEDDLREQLAIYNSDLQIFNDKDAFKLIRFNDVSERRRYRTWRMTVSNASAKRLLQEKRLFIDMQTVEVDAWAPGPRRCVNCFSTGHRANSPTMCTKLICNICSGEHKAKDCNKREQEDQHKCFVCMMNKETNSRHRATIRDCPRLKQEAIQEAQRVSTNIYG